jgi:hypothetical protein
MLANIGLNWLFWLAGAAAVTDRANAYINYFCGSGYFGRFASSTLLVSATLTVD